MEEKSGNSFIIISNNRLYGIERNLKVAFGALKLLVPVQIGIMVKFHTGCAPYTSQKPETQDSHANQLIRFLSTRTLSKRN